MLPKDAKERKNVPIATGCIDYFPDALVAVAGLSRVGNEQHNPGKSLQWDRSKSGDESDALMRHFLERGTVDNDGVRHSTKVVWRALAMLQKEIENDRTNTARKGSKAAEERYTDNGPSSDASNGSRIEEGLQRTEPVCWFNGSPIYGDVTYTRGPK